jgi:hypothetical protein
MAASCSSIILFAAIGAAAIEEFYICAGIYVSGVLLLHFTIPESKPKFYVVIGLMVSFLLVAILLTVGIQSANDVISDASLRDTLKGSLGDSGVADFYNSQKDLVRNLESYRTAALFSCFGLAIYSTILANRISKSRSAGVVI